MWTSNFRSTMLTMLSAAFICSCHSQNYSDLETLGISCPSKDRCRGYRNNLTYIDRSCECDYNCTAYKDCCIDALPSRRRQSSSSRPSARTDVTCLNYGEDDNTGVYVINKCSSNWNGPREVREKCIGSVDFSDPFTAAPVTDVARKETYRNLACAECNNAYLEALTNFRLKLRCPGLEELTDDQIMADLSYNVKYTLWGVHRLNKFGNGTEFIGCSIIFDVPDYLNSSVRFCRANLISKCASNWTHPAIARLCSQYLAAVYSNSDYYRNPHCAICNYKTIDEISCQKDLLGRDRPATYPLFVDINQSDGPEVGMKIVTTPECPSDHKYDPFFKKCRKLACGIPGYKLVNGVCRKG